MSKQLQVFDSLKAEVTIFTKPLLSLKVGDAESREVARAKVIEVKNLIKRVEERRKEYTDPLRAQIDELISYEKEITQPLYLVDSYLKAQQKAFEQEEAERRLKAQREAEAKRLEEEKVIAERRRKEAQEAEAKRALERKAAEEEAARLKAAADAQAAAEERKAKLFGRKTPEQVEAERFAAEQKIEQERKEKELALQQQEAEEKARIEREDKERQKVYAAEQKAIAAEKPKNTKMVKKFAVVDDTLIPRRFLILNETEVRKAMLAGEQIPGVKIWEEMEIVAR